MTKKMSTPFVCVGALGIKLTIAIFIHSRVTCLSHNDDERGDSQGRYVDGMHSIIIYKYLKFI